MNKSKAYIFIIALITLMIFGIAAICNLCGVPISVGETGQAESEGDEKETTKSDSGGSKQTTTSGTTAAETPDSIAEETPETPAAEETPETPAAEESISEDTPAQESAAEPVKVIFHANPSQTGAVDFSGAVDLGNVFVGYRGGLNNSVAGFVSFDIRELEGKNLQSATLIINVNSADVYNPKDKFGKLTMNRVDFGSVLDLSAFKTHVSPITSFDNNTTSINYSGENLLKRIKSALLDGKKRIQIKLGYEHPLGYNLSTTYHGFGFNASSATLEVTYLN